MKNSPKILIIISCLITFLFSLTSCKPIAYNLEDWLEKEFPNRFHVLDTFTDDIIGNLSFSVKTSIISEKSNDLIQSSLKWDKRLENFGLSKTKLDSAFSKAKREYSDAQSLIKTVHENGLKETSIGIGNGTVFVLIFAEPSQVHRKNSLDILQKSFVEWQKKGEYDRSICYIEPSEKDKNFKEIVPLLYWRQSGNEFLKYMLYSTVCPYNETFSASKVGKNWGYNTASNRFLKTVEEAKKIADKWASVHLKPPFEILKTAEFNQIKDNPTIINIKFPFTNKPKEAESTDYIIETDTNISLDFNVENNSLVGKIKMEKE